MCSSLSLSARWLLLACVGCSPPYGLRSSKATKSIKNKNDKLAVQLPIAYLGVPYNDKITGVLGLSIGPLHCADPASVSSDELVHSFVKVTDALRPAEEIGIVRGLKPMLAVPMAAPPDYNKLSFLQTTSIVDGATTVEESIKTSLGQDGDDGERDRSRGVGGPVCASRRYLHPIWIQDRHRLAAIYVEVRHKRSWLANDSEESYEAIATSRLRKQTR
jgi:hypothetical protein